MDLATHVKDNKCKCLSITWPLDLTLFFTPIYASLKNSTQLKRSKMGNIYFFKKKVKTTYKIDENNIQNKKKTDSMYIIFPHVPSSIYVDKIVKQKLHNSTYLDSPIHVYKTKKQKLYIYSLVHLFGQFSTCI
jgi:hypothetical protein